MITYGIDAGIKKKTIAVVKLDASDPQNVKLELLAPLAGITGIRPKGMDLAAARQEATKQADAAANAILQANPPLLPLAVDAPLTCAHTGDKRRHWESYVKGAFATPEFGLLNPATAWEWIALVWTQVFAKLHAAQIQLWTGPLGQQPTGNEWVAEVYPRVSYTSYYAAKSEKITRKYVYKGAAGAPCRDHVLEILEQLQWVSKPAASNTHARDAAIAALTMYRVMKGQARFLGEDPKQFNPVYSGGGIATF